MPQPPDRLSLLFEFMVRLKEPPTSLTDLILQHAVLEENGYDVQKALTDEIPDEERGKEYSLARLIEADKKFYDIQELVLTNSAKKLDPRLGDTFEFEERRASGEWGHIEVDPY